MSDEIPIEEATSPYSQHPTLTPESEKYLTRKWMRVCAELTRLRAELAESEARCLKHQGHEHCVTPCDSMRIQEENHNAYLTEKDRAEKAEADVAALKAERDAARDALRRCANPRMSKADMAVYHSALADRPALSAPQEKPEQEGRS